MNELDWLIIVIGIMIIISFFYVFKIEKYMFEDKVERIKEMMK